MEVACIISYTDVGRFGSITSVVHDVTNSWQHGYLTDSELIESVSEPGLCITNSSTPTLPSVTNAFDNNTP